MKKLVLATLLWVVAIGLWMPIVMSKSPNPHQELYDEVLAPIVKIVTPQGTGSGVVLSDTYVLSAAHVVGNNNEVQVITYSYHEDTKAPSSSASCPCLAGRQVRAFVVMTDTVKDLALLRINGTQINAGHRDIVYPAKLAPRNYQPYLFTPVWAVGCSLGRPPRPSYGHITAITNPDNQRQSVKRQRNPVPYGASYLEISAPILPGNSGGGVFLKDSFELIGIVVWVRVYQGQLVTTAAGVVPIDQIHEFLAEAGILQVTTFPDPMIGRDFRGQGLHYRFVLNKASVSFQYGEVSERRARVTGAIRLIDATCSNRVCSGVRGRHGRPKSLSKSYLFGTQ